MFRRTFPTIATSLAVFLATLSLLFWQVRTGHDPALSANRIALVSSGHGPGAVQTKTSGHHSKATTPGHRHGAKPVRTSSSGGHGGGGESD